MNESHLSEEELDHLRQIDTPTVSNVLDRLLGPHATSLYSYSSMELRCLFADLPPMVGYAVTCLRANPQAGRAEPPKDRLLYEAIAASPKPVVVVCQYSGDDRQLGNAFGDIMATTFQRLGAVGAMTDGGIRDLAGIRLHAPGFQVFTPGVVAAAGESVIVKVGVPVVVCGMTIKQGDLVHGDSSGVVSVPHHVARQVPPRSRELLIQEQSKLEFIMSREFSLDELARRSGWK